MMVSKYLFDSISLYVASTGSAGNCYLLKTCDMTIILDAGISFKNVVNHIDSYDNIYLLISHYHGDHAGYLDEFIQHGIKPIYGNDFSDERIRIKALKAFHDIDCYMYYIKLIKENHTIAYITDTSQVPYIFQPLNTLIIESNYDDEIIDNQAMDNNIHVMLYNRIKENHMSMSSAINYIKKYRYIDNIIFIHLSDTRMNEKKLITETKKITAGNIYAAKIGQLITLKF